MFVYIIFFIVIALLGIQYEFAPFDRGYPLWVLTALLVLLAGFRDISVSRDYTSYQYIFNSVSYLKATTYYGNSLAFLLAFEPGFLLIITFFKSLFPVNYGFAIMLFYALASIPLKTITIRKLSINPYLSLLFFYSYFFLIQEMTQIRIGLASGIVLISLTGLLEGKKFFFISMVLLATCFHYSSIFYLAILFFNNERFYKPLYTGVILLSVVLGVIKLPVLSVLGNVDLSDVSTKLNNYAEMSQYGLVKINVFNSLNLLNIACCLYLIFAVSNKGIREDRYLRIFLKCNILSIFLLSVLSGAPSIALRFSQLFGIVYLFLFVYLSRYLPFRKWNVFVVTIIAGIFFYVTLFYGDLLQPYKIITIR